MAGGLPARSFPPVVEKYGNDSSEWQSTGGGGVSIQNMALPLPGVQNMELPPLGLL